MKTLSKVLFGSIMMTLMACNTTKVTSDYDREASFKNYTSYQIVEEDEQVPADMNPFHIQRINKAIKTEMNKLNYRPSQDPDLLVAFTVTVKDKQDINTYPMYGRRWWGFNDTQVDVNNYEEGRLVINLIDAESGEVVWYGSVTNVLTDNVKKMEGKIQKAVQAIFESYSKVS